MSFVFDLEHSIQLVGHIFRCFDCDKLNIMKTLKLLYIADRESLKKAGYPLTGDTPCAMKHGPVLSQIYDLMKTDSEWSTMTQDGEETRWCEFFSKEHNDLRLKKATGCDELSEHDMSVIENVCREYKSWDQFALSNHTHEFPEWKRNEAGDSSRPIPLRDLLEAVGRFDDIDSIEQDRIEARHFFHLFNG